MLIVLLQISKYVNIYVTDQKYVNIYVTDQKYVNIYVTEHKYFNLLRHLSRVLLNLICMLITILVVFNLSYQSIKSLLLETKWMFEHQDLQMFGFKLNIYEYFSTTWSCGSR